MAESNDGKDAGAGIDGDQKKRPVNLMTSQSR